MKYLWTLALCAGLLLVFGARVLFYIHDWESSNLAPLAHNPSTALGTGRKVVVEGEVVEDPDRRDTTVHVTIHISKLASTTVDGTLLAFLPPDTQLSYGQKVVAKGTLRVPDSFVGDNGSTFDYPHYLQVHGISALLTNAQLISKLAAPFSFKGGLYGLKHTFNNSLGKIFPPPQSALIEGILLGERRGLSPTLTGQFVAAGLIHIVILAGYVLSLVADGVLRALSILPKKFCYPLAGIFLVLFVVMIGASPSTVRACIMALVGLVARYFNRTAAALRSLAIAAGLMIVWNPPIVVWDESFIISVVSTFGLITLAPAIEHWLAWVPEKFEARATATSTLAVQLFALPAILYYTGTLSPLALPANLAVLPALPLIMLSGFLAGLFHLIPGALGFVFAFVPALICQLLLRWILFVVSLVNAIPYASATVHQFPGWLALALYAPLIAVSNWKVFRTALRRATNLNF